MRILSYLFPLGCILQPFTFYNQRYKLVNNLPFFKIIRNEFIEDDKHTKAKTLQHKNNSILHLWTGVVCVCVCIWTNKNGKQWKFRSSVRCFSCFFFLLRQIFLVLNFILLLFIRLHFIICLRLWLSVAVGWLVFVVALICALFNWKLKKNYF